MRDESAGGMADFGIFFTFDSFYVLDCDVAVAFLSLALYHSMVGADDGMRSSDLFFTVEGLEQQLTNKRPPPSGLSESEP